ncbi:hypothetical protein C2S51_028322 [Perilla frutescens var. frutescens]|nr:hypothetical protein C2S51_028322 [Perilla frutescens var. frutescens]
MGKEYFSFSEWNLDEFFDDYIQFDGCSQPLSDSSDGESIDSIKELRSINGSQYSSSDDDIQSTRIEGTKGDVSFRLGQVFASINDFYDAVKNYGIYNMYGLKFVQKDKKRCRVKCVDKCPWLIFCSKVGNFETYKVKTFVDNHNCQKEEVREKFANTTWLGNMVIGDFRNHPKMTGEELKSLVAEKYKITISISKAYRIKEHAQQLLDGDVAQQYSRLADYCEELVRTNPGSTVELLAPKQGQNGPSRFERIYICIDACRRGFLVGCRPLIALDGCHLTGYYRGQLLAAVGLDGNNGLFVLAYAVVASETKDTWQWFLKKLLSDIGQESIRGERWTFISDQGKGLVPALDEMYPSSYHRFCIRHMYSNIQKKWKDEQVRSLFWSAATSTTRNKFEMYMDRMKDKDYSLWEYLTRIGVERWSRAHFQEHVKCHILSSSIVECFNGVIKKFRDNPIDILIDNIRIKVRSLMRKKKEKMKREGGVICPKILKKLNPLIVESTSWHVASYGDVSFEVALRPQRFVVHLHNNTCTCRVWDLTGVPCVHACAAIKFMKGRPEEYVHEYFSRENFFRAYEYEIKSMTSPDFWSKTDNQPIQPPLLRRPSGRPKKQRHKSSIEGKDPHKAKRKYGVIKCSKCCQLGHNKRSCKEVNELD